MEQRIPPCSLRPQRATALAAARERPPAKMRFYPAENNEPAAAGPSTDDDANAILEGVPAFGLYACNRGIYLGQFGGLRGPCQRGIVEHQRRTACLVATLHSAPKRAIKIGVRLLEVADDLEVDALHLRQVDLFDMDEPQQLTHGLRHLAAALVTRASALRDADLGPELLLVEPKAPPYFAGIEDAVEEFHGVVRLEVSSLGLANSETFPEALQPPIPLAYFSPKQYLNASATHPSGKPAPPPIVSAAGAAHEADPKDTAIILLESTS